MYKTYQFRIKDDNKALRRKFTQMGEAVNTVWNFCEETQRHDIAWGKPPSKWRTEYEFYGLTSGSSIELGIPADTIQLVCSQYITSRKIYKKRGLKFRGRRSTIWVPFRSKTISIKIERGTAKFYGINFRFWNSYKNRNLGEIATGSVSQDSQGHFYLNIICKQPELTEDEMTKREIGLSIRPEIGIDLGIKTLFACSNGYKQEAPKFYAKLEKKIATAQRAKHQKQVKKLHAKVANQRDDFIKKQSTIIVNSARSIFVGNLNPTKIIAKPGFAKATYDASLFQLKLRIKNKAFASGVFYTEVNEAYSTMICSCCFKISSTSPKGISGLSIREWTCANCGVIHDRDINASLNILRFGRESPVTTLIEAKRKVTSKTRVKNITKSISISVPLGVSISSNREDIKNLTDPDMKQEVQEFDSEADVLKALAAGTVTVNTPIKLRQH